MVSGEIVLEGEDLLAVTDQRIRSLRGNQMAMVFQDPLSALHPYYTIGNQIVEAYRIHHSVSKDVARKRAIEMLERVGIPNPNRRVDQYPHEFSGGMRQRAMIAMAHWSTTPSCSSPTSRRRRSTSRSRPRSSS